MKKLLFLIIIIISPSLAFAWNLEDHRLLSRLALQEVREEWKLTKPCEVHPLQSFLNKIATLRPEIADEWHFSNYIQINQKIYLSDRDSYHYREANVGNRETLAPWEILFLYSTDPDDGRDQDLLVRDAEGKPHQAFSDQKWFGVTQGPNSQAFRHIEKPAFRILHPINTFGVPPWSIGEASRRAEIYFQLSKLAFAVHEDYWGWRFLAGSFHYLEDLHQPYHAGQISPALLKKGIKALVTWGWKTKGFMGTFAHIVANSHRFFESYVENSQSMNLDLKNAALKSLSGKDKLELSESSPNFIEALAHRVRDESNLSFVTLTSAVSNITDPVLDGPYEFKSDDHGQDDPMKFLKEGPDFSKNNQKIFEIVRERFSSVGRVLRTEVSETLKFRQNETQETPKTILEKIDPLLVPMPKVSEKEAE